MQKNSQVKISKNSGDPLYISSTLSKLENSLGLNESLHGKNLTLFWICKGK